MDIQYQVCPYSIAYNSRAWLCVNTLRIETSFCLIVWLLTFINKNKTKKKKTKRIGCLLLIRHICETICISFYCLFCFLVFPVHRQFHCNFSHRRWAHCHVFCGCDFRFRCLCERLASYFLQTKRMKHSIRIRGKIRSFVCVNRLNVYVYDHDLKLRLIAMLFSTFSYSMFFSILFSICLLCMQSKTISYDLSISFAIAEFEINYSLSSSSILRVFVCLG